MSGLPDPAPRFYEDEKPIELRPVEHEIYFTRDQRPPNFNMWLRATASLPDDPVLHRAFLAFMSDMTLQDASLLPHGHTFYDFTRLMTASLDHCVWFHGPVRVDSWLLYVQDSPWAGGARGLSRGSFFTADGRLVASTAQEGMIRQRRSRQA
jgi:acyl-CoA thioesterase-2